MRKNDETWLTEVNRDHAEIREDSTNGEIIVLREMKFTGFEVNRLRATNDYRNQNKCQTAWSCFIFSFPTFSASQPAYSAHTGAFATILVFSDEKLTGKGIGNKEDYQRNIDCRTRGGSFRHTIIRETWWRCVQRRLKMVETVKHDKRRVRSTVSDRYPFESQATRSWIYVEKAQYISSILDNNYVTDCRSRIYWLSNKFILHSFFFQCKY